MLPRLIQGGMGAGVSGWTLAREVSSLGQLGVVSGHGPRLDPRAQALGRRPGRACPTCDRGLPVAGDRPVRPRPLLPGRRPDRGTAPTRPTRPARRTTDDEARRAGPGPALQARPAPPRLAEPRATGPPGPGELRRGVPRQGGPRRGRRDQLPREDPAADAAQPVRGDAGRRRRGPDGRRHPGRDPGRPRSAGRPSRRLHRPRRARARRRSASSCAFDPTRDRARRRGRRTGPARATEVPADRVGRDAGQGAPAQVARRHRRVRGRGPDRRRAQRPAPRPAPAVGARRAGLRPARRRGPRADEGARRAVLAGRRVRQPRRGSPRRSPPGRTASRSGPRSRSARSPGWIRSCADGSWRTSCAATATSSPTRWPRRPGSRSRWPTLEGTLSEADAYEERPRLCDLGYLRRAYVRADGTLDYRCPSEPVDDYVRKGGRVEDTVGRKCLCNALVTNIGLGQRRADGYEELPMLTAGDDIACVRPFITPERPVVPGARRRRGAAAGRLNGGRPGRVRRWSGRRLHSPMTAQRNPIMMKNPVNIAMRASPP